MIKFSIPIRTGRGLNERMHHMQRARTVKAERQAVELAVAHQCPPNIPVTINLCRVAPHGHAIHHNELPAALSQIRTALSEWVGSDGKGWEYGQRPGKKGEWLVEVEISKFDSIEKQIK